MNPKFFILTLFFLGFLSSCQKDNQGLDSNQNSIRISTSFDPTTLDARLGQELPTVNVLALLYEGLMRTDNEGNLVYALAESLAISKDLKTYTFKLRQSAWSDGKSLTAQDFEETWKSALNPQFPSPNAYQLFPIKGAKAYKEGKGLVDQVGIRASDSHTLVVELEAPTPYFLKLLSTHFYFPVSSELRKSQSEAPHALNSDFVSNGPFKLHHWKRNNELVIEKNPLYWDSEEILKGKLSLLVLDENTAYQMFEAGELDWTGSPLCAIPQDAVHTLRQQERLSILSAAGTHYYSFNTESPPFDNVKFRKAFALAINRQAIVDHVTQGGQLPATAFVPLFFGLNGHYFEDDDSSKAWELLEGALKEMNKDRDQLPSITLTYSASDRNHKIAQAVQQQWSKVLGIEVKLEGLESKSFYQKINRYDYQLAARSWFADIPDPVNFLEIFKSKNNGSNTTRWENADYTKLLNASNEESDPVKRYAILKEAETILMDHMPIAPIFFAAFNYLKNEKMDNITLSEFGILNFRSAYLDDEDQD
jgi:oligopeptide transport system substrate-binding protein